MKFKSIISKYILTIILLTIVFGIANYTCYHLFYWPPFLFYIISIIIFIISIYYHKSKSIRSLWFLMPSVAFAICSLYELWMLNQTRNEVGAVIRVDFLFIETPFLGIFIALASFLAFKQKQQ